MTRTPDTTTELPEIRVDWQTGFGLSWTPAAASTMELHAHALRVDDEVWLLDPFDGIELDATLATLGGTVAHVVVLLDRHMRDAIEIARRHGATLHVVDGPIRQDVPADAERFDDALRGSPFAIVPVRRSGKLWQERALWWAEHELLVIAESLGSSDAFTLGTDSRVAVHPVLRLTPPTAAFARATPKLLLFGHGPAVTEHATSALQQALEESRSSTPQLISSIARAALRRLRS